MKTVIYKYDLTATDEQQVALPDAAQLLTVQAQRDTPRLWARIDPAQARSRWLHVRIFGTGHPIAGDPGDYLGTFQIHGGSLVFHVFATWGEIVKQTEDAR